MNIQPVTLAMVAKEAGYSTATVSRCLRNDPKLPLPTREKVAAAAARLGYRPNALVSMFQAHIRLKNPEKYQANIAWIDDQPNPQAWKQALWLQGYLAGAQRRAESQGFKIEIVRLEELRDWSPELNVKRFARILEARGIHGAILPLLTHPTLIAGDWPCAVTAIGTREIALETAEGPSKLRPRNWHKVVPDYFQNIHIALREVAALGYKRPGLFLSRWVDRYVGWQLKGGFLAEQSGEPSKNRVPPLLSDNILDTKTNGLNAWLDEWKPDCVLCGDSRVKALLEKTGRTVPGDIGLVHVGWERDVEDWAGVDERHEALGEAAVDIVVSQLRRNEAGEPSVARTTSLPGVWVPGKTVRAQN